MADTTTQIDAPRVDAPADPGKRDFLTLLTGATVVIGMGALVWPFVSSMSPASDGGFWVAMPAPTTAALLTAMQHPWLRWVVAWLPPSLQPSPTPHSAVIKVSLCSNTERCMRAVHRYWRSVGTETCLLARVGMWPD